MDALDSCVAQMRACADKLRSTKDALSLTFLDMKARDLPAITTAARLVFEPEEKEDDIVEKSKRRYDASVKQAEEHIDKLLAEKKKLEQDLRRQSHQFRQVLEERDADVQVEYAKMLAELNDHIEDSKQQLSAAIESRDAKQVAARSLPSPSLANQADLHEHHTLQQRIIAMSKEVSELQVELHALDDELARPVAVKRKADALDKDDAGHHLAAAQECADIQAEIDMLVETDKALRDQATQRRLHAAQQEQNVLALRDVEEMEQEAAAVEASLATLSSRLQAQLFRVLAPTSSMGALLTRLCAFISSQGGSAMAISDVLQMCPSQGEGIECIDLLEKVGVVVSDGVHLRQASSLQ